MTKNKIPEFATIQEEALFWDTHDITDFLDELKPVKAVYTPGEKKEVMAIRIAPSLKTQVEQMAQNYDISSSSLIRMWIIDKLRTAQET